MLSRDQIARMFPAGSPAWIDKLAELGPALAEHYSWTGNDWRHAMGQVWAETSGLSLRSMRENMRFTSAARIKEVYSYRLRLALKNNPDFRSEYGTVDALARALVGNPDLLADVVYGGREGTPPDQGHRYIGRGPTQITHLNNYREIRDEIRQQPGGESCPDITETPEALERPEMGVRSLFADWKVKGLHRWSKDDGTDAVKQVSSVLNTGSSGKWGVVNGQGERLRGYARACAIWQPDEALFGPATVAYVLPSKALKRGDECEGVTDLQMQLQELGFAVGNPDGCYGELTERAVLAAQKAHGLPVTGEADATTVSVLERSGKIDLPRASMTADDLRERGSRTVAEGDQLTTMGKVLKWFGLGTSTAGAAELADPGTITKLVDLAPKVSTALTSPAMLKMLAIGFGVGLLAIGWRISTGGKRVVLFRLEDAQSGEHIGR